MLDCAALYIYIYIYKALLEPNHILNIITLRYITNSHVSHKCVKVHHHSMLISKLQNGIPDFPEIWVL